MCEYINHVHISEPGLSEVQFDERVEKLFDGLAAGQYCGYVSLEMKNQCDLYAVKSCVRQMKGVAEKCGTTRS